MGQRTVDEMERTASQNKWNRINRFSDYEQSSDRWQALTQYSVRVTSEETLEATLTEISQSIDEQQSTKVDWKLLSI